MPRADDGRDCPPLHERRLCRAERSGNGARARQRYLAQRFTRRRVREVEIIDTAGGDPLAPDVVAEGFHTRSLGTGRALSTDEVDVPHSAGTAFSSISNR